MRKKMQWCIMPCRNASPMDSASGLDRQYLSACDENMVYWVRRRVSAVQARTDVGQVYSRRVSKDYEKTPATKCLLAIGLSILRSVTKLAAWHANVEESRPAYFLTRTARCLPFKAIFGFGFVCVCESVRSLLTCLAEDVVTREYHVWKEKTDCSWYIAFTLAPFLAVCRPYRPTL